MLKHNFRQLTIWSDSVKLAKEVYQLTQGFAKEHKSGISSQLYRAAISIPSNIAEGSARKSEKEFSRFLCISLGSAFELETQLLIASECGLSASYDYDVILSELRALQRQIPAFSENLKAA
ncbi:four helix bundle protein [Mucilaginibacter sp.]